MLQGVDFVAKSTENLSQPVTLLVLALAPGLRPMST
jgi:hypothetical protein